MTNMVFNRQNELHLGGIKEICLSNFELDPSLPLSFPYTFGIIYSKAFPYEVPAILCYFPTVSTTCTEAEDQQH